MNIYTGSNGNNNINITPADVTLESLLFATGNYMVKVNHRNTRARCEICTIKTPERRE